MVNIKYRKKGIKIQHVWFDKNLKDTLEKSNSDIVFVHGHKNCNFGTEIVNKQYSLTTDLTLTIEEILKKFNKNYRNEINRAKREEVICEIFTSDDLKNNRNLINKFENEHEEFTKLKGIRNAYNSLVINEYIKSGNIILTKSKKDNIDYSQHIYIYDNECARLLYSVSNFRTNGLDSKIIGRANKYLHFYDIEELKRRDIKIMDWGGISSTINPNGVDKFKIEFGGEFCDYYNIIIGKTLIGKIVIWILKLKGRL